VENEDKKELLLKFGKNLRKLRESKDFTQAQLANELNVEISQISRIERGLINTSVTTIFSIASVLKVSISDLFDFE
jgi:transcriptional regulator with XRE-family HTH domain